MKLINNDCMNVFNELSDNSVDLIYTDPPYEMREFVLDTTGTANSIMKLSETLLPLNKVIQHEFDLEKFCSECVRVLKDINIYIWCNKKQIYKYLEFFVGRYSCKFDILTWYKTNAMPTYYNKYLDDCEYCLYFHNGNAFVKPSCYENAKKLYISPINRENKKYGHPTIKPLPFVTRMIDNSTKEGDIVFDPYMGSGTTGVAVRNLDRKLQFIGVEIDKGFFDIARNRINNDNQKYEVGSRKELF